VELLLRFHPFPFILIAMTQLELCNLALDKLGEPPITSIGASTPAAQACTRLYQPTLDALVRKYRWNFARESVQLKAVWVAATSVFLESVDVIRINKTAHGLAVGQRVLLETSDYPDANGHFFITAVSTNHFHVSAPGAANITSSLGKYHIAPQHTWNYKIALPNDCLALRTVEGYEVSRPHQFFVLEGRSIFCNLEEVEVTYTQKQEGGTDEANFDTIFNDLFACMLAAELAMPVTGAMSRRGDMMSLYGEVLQTALMSNVFERRDNLIDRTAGPTSANARQYA
jgi:hypothetical protein